MKLRYLLVSSLMVLNGCALWSSGSSEAPVRLRERLEVPPDLSRSGGDDLSALPTTAVAATRASAPVSNAPSAAPLSVGVPANSQARLEREGNQRWLVVNAAPDPVWSVLRDYLKHSHGDLAVESAKYGYLETDWVEQRPNLGQSGLGRVLSKFQSTGLRDKFRVRVESGRIAGTTEVMVSHIGLEETIIGSGSSGPNTMWQPRKSDPVLEADLLDHILAALGAIDPTTRPPLTAEQTAVKRAPRPRGSLALVGETSDSAWRKVSQALDRSGVQIEDRDRGSGLLFVRFRDQVVEKDSGGLFGRIFGDRKKDVKADDGQDRYQLRLKTDKNGVVVDVLDVKGEIDKSDTANRLLDLLYQQLF